MSEAIKERPINARTWEVRAMLAGGKCQFRVPLKNQPIQREDGTWSRWHSRNSTVSNLIRKVCIAPNGDEISNELHQVPVGEWMLEKSPFKVGQRLWVREAFYNRADYAKIGKLHGQRYVYAADAVKSGWKKHSSTHMPRWASRITLEIEDVKVERLQEIADYDAFEEGLEEWLRSTTRESAHDSVRHAYSRLWESLRGPNSWKRNPWVSAITFKVQQ